VLNLTNADGDKASFVDRVLNLNQALKNKLISMCSNTFTDKITNASTGGTAYDLRIYHVSGKLQLSKQVPLLQS
jgi:hypothetical protein